MFGDQTVGRIVTPEQFHIRPSGSWIPILLVYLFFALSSMVFAQISPGKLTDAHESLEGITNCTQCHELGQAVSRDKCFTCHQALMIQIDEERGYHSSTDVKGETCSTCHSEHHGREYELIFWPSGQSEFEHELTGWDFSGRHAELNCDQCHQPRFHRWENLARDNSTDEESTFLGLSSTCTACHEDEHGDQLGDDCMTCHNESEWKPAPGFVHNRDAEYLLTGKHLDLSCEKCHVEFDRVSEDESVIVHAGTPTTFIKYTNLTFANCVDCHRDPHDGRLSNNCARCHTTDGFFSANASEEFDHSRTGFPLVGLHQQVDCKKCHVSGKMTDPIAYETCVSCHNDEHQGQFADRSDRGRCDACHTVEKPFKRHNYTIADHEQSSYALTGSHLAIPCVLCHVQEELEDGDTYTRFEYAETRCQSCHKDEHRGQLDMWIEQNGCEYCHNTATWHQTSFDHVQARFRLEGKHREILCLKCHWIETDEGEQLVWMKPLEMVCAGCHDEPHGAQFSQNGRDLTCEGCHQATGWDSLLFNHDLDTDFTLGGGHENVDCANCHLPFDLSEPLVIQYRGTSKECKECHKSAPTPSGRG